MNCSRTVEIQQSLTVKTIPWISNAENFYQFPRNIYGNKPAVNVYSDKKPIALEGRPITIFPLDL